MKINFVKDISSIKDNCILFTGSEKSTMRDLAGGFELLDGKVNFNEGPMIRAMKQGLPLLIINYRDLSPEINDVLYQVSEELTYLSLEISQVVVAQKGFKIIFKS
jgi:hypothetical protein